MTENHESTYRLCQVDDIQEGTSKGFTLPDKKSVFAVKRDGEIFIYQNSCPHLGVELEWLEDQFLDNEGVLIQCSTHGALFVIETGDCVSGPCVGKALQPVPFHIKEGTIFITILV